METSQFRRSPNFSFVPAVQGAYKVIVTVQDSSGTASLESAAVTVTEKPVDAHYGYGNPDDSHDKNHK